jgi:hypothetical protein
MTLQAGYPYPMDRWAILKDKGAAGLRGKEETACRMPRFEGEVE